MDPNPTWLQAAKDFGTPVAFLVALLYGAWRGGWQICSWLAPRIEKLLDAHVAFLGKTGDAIEAQTPKVEEIRGKVGEIHGMVTKIQGQVQHAPQAG